MTGINETAIINLEKNLKSDYIEGIEILLRLLGNIIREPDNHKYRKIKVTNKIIKVKLLSLAGIHTVLTEIGFLENDNELHLSSNILIASLKKYREFIAQRLELIKASTTTVQSNPSCSTASVLENVADIIRKTDTGAIKKVKKVEKIPCIGFEKKTKFPKVLVTNNSELQYLERLSDNFMQYDDEKLQVFAKSLIPLEILKQGALTKLRSIQKAIIKENKNIEEPLYDEIFLIELMNWFNTKFFTWVNDIQCKLCSNSKKCEQVTAENGIRVEIINCCGMPTKFYRYNDVSILLRTRKGRCGEYANCFTFLCYCLGYETRFVHGNFDHVWTEVYSHAQKRWIHYDPSENIFDAPLVYQHGWKRDVEYVTAFSVDDVQDVTWRYTSDYKQTLSIRKTFTEDELLKSIILLREKRQTGKNISEVRKTFLKVRNLVELATLLTPRQPTSDEKAGRSSGSLDWRLLRGEQSISLGYVFKLNEIEKSLKQFCLRYSCTKNIYERVVRDTQEILVCQSNWESCTFMSENVFLKKELDWKMVYLARTEESDAAKIEWKFDFTESGLRVKAASVKFLTKCYESGQIILSYLNERGETVTDVDHLKNSNKFTMIVNLSGGQGDIAWQHTQLFRQEFDSTEYPFEIFLELF